jgi:hypothetical protein
MFYILCCRECGDPEHTAATGHDSWIVLDQPEPGDAP